MRLCECSSFMLMSHRAVYSDLCQKRVFSLLNLPIMKINSAALLHFSGDFNQINWCGLQAGVWALSAVIVHGWKGSSGSGKVSWGPVLYCSLSVFCCLCPFPLFLQTFLSLAHTVPFSVHIRGRYSIMMNRLSFLTFINPNIQFFSV